MSNLFLMPHVILTGENALEAAAEYIDGAGKKALVVTDQNMVAVGNVAKLTDVLSRQNKSYVIYDGVNSEPTDDMVEKGKEIYLANGCDFLVAVGGGSPIDTMKAVGAMVTNPGAITDYMGKTIPNATPPMIAVPTTAGTGSEATQFTIITDTSHDVKMLLKGPKLIPHVAVVDYRFSMSAPPKVTAATGLDALTHAIEAYTSKKAQPMSDIFAMSAVRKIFRSILRAYEDGSDKAAHEGMAAAALEAGIAFNNSSVTLVHGMSRPIGALFHVPHGLSNAMLLPKCLAFALPGAEERFAQLGRAVGADSAGMDDAGMGKAFIYEVERICQGLHIDTLESFGVDRLKFDKNVDKMTADALASGSPANTCRPVTDADVAAIYRSLWDEVK